MQRKQRAKLWPSTLAPTTTHTKRVRNSARSVTAVPTAAAPTVLVTAHLAMETCTSNQARVRRAGAASGAAAGETAAAAAGTAVGAITGEAAGAAAGTGATAGAGATAGEAAGEAASAGASNCAPIEGITGHHDGNSFS